METFKSFKRNIFKEAKVDNDLYNILYELQNGIGKCGNEPAMLFTGTRVAEHGDYSG